MAPSKRSFEVEETMEEPPKAMDVDKQMKFDPRKYDFPALILILLNVL